MTYRLSRSDKEKWTADPRRPQKRPPVKIPAIKNNALIEEHHFTLIGRVTNPSIQKTRAVLVNGLKPLEMKMDISLPSGEIKEVELQYEKLEKHCFNCFSLSHEVENCPSQRARSGHYGPRASQLGISQRQTLDNIDAGRRRADTRKQHIHSPEPEQHFRGRSESYNRNNERAMNWSNDKDFCVHYGARRDPHYNEKRLVQGPSGHVNSRASARDRLSLPKDSSGSHRTGNSHPRGGPQRSEWRPVQGGSISRQSHVSHTPSPKPDREQMHTPGIGPHAPSRRSGERSHSHSERRSALERLTGSNERIPLLLDGEANAESGRLQRSNAQLVDDSRQHLSSRGSSKPPSSRTAGKAHEDKSPIRTLSEDRRHVSLRLGPMVDSEETIIEDIPLPRRNRAANLPKERRRQLPLRPLGKEL
uniref:Zinc knuckle CX2CX4HX4C domain-containing protein n=1 Tax=Brassica oleracea TaxID=3712 RepID=A0A3P6DZG3_BRAOL|nr:unnamed protein product [Brassica oleracea]